MTITEPERVSDLIGEWPKNESNAPARDDESARLETIRLAEWWLNLRPAGFVASVGAGPTESNPPKGWHVWFELAHPAFARSSSSSRIASLRSRIRSARLG